MKRAMWAIVATLGVTLGCYESPTAPSVVAGDGSYRRVVAPFRNRLDTVPFTTEACRHLPPPPTEVRIPPLPSAPPPLPYSPRFRGAHGFGRFDSAPPCSWQW